jgi:hypothetical protein
MVNAESFASEFQRRRQLAWRAIRWWLFFSGLGLIGMLSIAANSFDERATTLGAALLLFVMACLAVAYFNVRRHFRCPRCNQVPRQVAFGWRDEFGSEVKDIPWDPIECPSCHARLR